MRCKDGVVAICKDVPTVRVGDVGEKVCIFSMASKCISKAVYMVERTKMTNVRVWMRRFQYHLNFEPRLVACP